MGGSRGAREGKEAKKEASSGDSSKGGGRAARNRREEKQAEPPAAAASGGSAGHRLSHLHVVLHASGCLQCLPAKARALRSRELSLHGNVAHCSAR